MKISDIFKTKRKILNYDQALLIKITFNSKSGYQDIKKLETSIVKALPEGSHLDGDDISDKDAVIYLYGPSTDLIFKRIESLLKSSIGFSAVVANLQYGRPDDPATVDIDKKII